MQNAHVLSHPIWIVTQAAWSTSRRAGSADGYASCSSRISTTGPLGAGPRDSSAARWTLWVPNTTSTCGARSWTRSRSFWARHPPTTICRSGRAVLQRLQVAEVAVELVVGVLPDAARVEHDDVGVVERRRSPPALGREQARRCARSRARSSGTRRCGRGTAWSRRAAYRSARRHPRATGPTAASAPRAGAPRTADVRAPAPARPRRPRAGRTPERRRCQAHPIG